MSGKRIAAATNAPINTAHPDPLRRLLQAQVEKLTRHPALRESTMSGLERWAQVIRERADART